tara:strand:+ start:2644 stop:4716 length:2073 start_codon:yes stop_codon:yes gene_type:complete
MKKNYSLLIAILLTLNFSLFSQTAPPWDFNGTVENFVGSNYSSIVAGDSYATYTITSPNNDGNGGSANPNMRNEDAMIDTSVGNYVALTIQNTTGNTRVQVITTVNGSNAFTNFDGLTANDTGFVTHYINMSSNANWSGTLGTINFRFKESAANNQNVFSGDILVDNIEVVASIPATPRVDYTFDDTSDSEGFVGANGVTLSQPIAGELELDIADQSPYPKLEQSGLYSVDADSYKYVQVTLVNSSSKNKLTFTSPSGGNEFSTSDMTINSTEVQNIEVDLSALTNWSGTQSSWWFQLVDNPGDGPTSSAGTIYIQQILFTEESTQEPDECPIPVITGWTMTGDGVIFDGTNEEGVTGYQIEYSTSTFTQGDGTATVYEFDAFPHTMTGLQPSTTYYFSIRSICGDGNYSEWEQNPDNNGDGPDAWTTSSCPSSYSLPYFNDFNDPDVWTNCQTFNDNDGDGNFWFYVNYADIDGDGNNVAASASWTSTQGALTPDNWVIMGPIDLTDHTDAVLEWNVRGIDPSWCSENYSVYVGSSYNYSDLLNGSVTYNETIAAGGDACGNTFGSRLLDISAATGGLVYIGFRHHGVSDMFVLNIDDVAVTSSTMSNEDFSLENINYTFNHETDILRVNSDELLSKIEIFNMLGQQVLNKNLNETSVSLNLSNLSSAIYIVNIEGNNSKIKTFKLAIK